MAVASKSNGQAMRAPESELTRRHHLKFTGNCTLPEFETLCAEQDFWYHSYYFDNGFVQRGDYDIGHDIAAYGFRQDMTGMYELRPQLFDDRKFDLVFMGALLMHLRDPIGALIAARSVCRNRLIATALVHLGIDEEPRPRMTLMSPETNVHSWWIPNKACLLQ